MSWEELGQVRTTEWVTNMCGVVWGIRIRTHDLSLSLTHTHIIMGGAGAGAGAGAAMYITCPERQSEC